MSIDVIIGHDGKPRCGWIRADDPATANYHDEVWGTRTYDDSALFEVLTLGVFEIGLSWSTVFRKRDAFRNAFHGFGVAKVAAMTGQDVDQLVQDTSIIRNRAKIQATIDNARAMRTASPSLAELAKSHAVSRTRSPRSIAELPTSTPLRGNVRKAVEVAGLPLRRPYQCVRVHAERRRRQRPRPRLLPRHRLPRRLSESGPRLAANVASPARRTQLPTNHSPADAPSTSPSTTATTVKRSSQPSPKLCHFLEAGSTRCQCSASLLVEPDLSRFIGLRVLCALPVCGGGLRSWWRGRSIQWRWEGIVAAPAKSPRINVAARA